MGMFDNWIYQKYFAPTDQKTDVLGSGMSGGAAGAMDMFGDQAPSVQNLGISNAPMSVLANAQEQTSGTPWNTVGMKGLLGLAPGAANLGAGLAKVSGALGDNGPHMQQLDAPPSYGHFPTEGLSDILNRAGILGPQALQIAKQLGLIHG